ncbi:MAG: DUF47 family protein [Desulfurococcaceae archaeon]
MLSDILSRESMVKLEKYVDLVTKASEKFTEAIKLLNDIKISEARSTFTEVIKLLDESGKYKAMLEDDVAETRLDPGLKEEILTLVNMIDDVGDMVKEASREFTILPFLEIPVQLRTGLVNLSKIVSTIIHNLSEAISSFIKGNYDKVEEELRRILSLEEEADRLELENRATLLSFSEKLKPYAIQLLVHDLNALLENTADLCTRASRRIKLMILAWLS